jgi:hypothetical protein
MATKSTFGFLRMASGDSYTAPTPNKEMQIRALIWAGMNAAGTAQITDANTSTVCYMSASAKDDHVVLDGHFWGESVLWKTPITFTPSGGSSGGALFIVL